MKQHCTLFLVISFFTINLPNLSAQLFIDTSYTAEQMVMDFFDGGCVDISNVTFVGVDVNMAYFEAANTPLGIPAGIFLSTGDVFTAIGPNMSGGTSTGFLSPGDADLENLLGGMLTNDAAVLEMDIVPMVDFLDFSYVFGSEEYLEFVNSGFNDVFAFFVSGPGIDGNQNIAVVPEDPTVPVSINSINNGSYGQYYVANDNNELPDFEFDGLTTTLPAPFSVVPGETYHLKLAIADVGDAAFDSGVFIGIESLCGGSELTPPAIIEIEQDGSTINFQNLSRYATSYLWDFGDNTTFTDRYPLPHTYAVDGNYEVTLITENYCCMDTTSIMITVGNPTSINDLASKPFLLSPNPTNDQFTIQWKERLEAQVALYDVSGRILESFTTNDDIHINLFSRPAGLYNVLIKTEIGVYNERVLKN